MEKDSVENNAENETVNKLSFNLTSFIFESLLPSSSKAKL